MQMMHNTFAKLYLLNTIQMDTIHNWGLIMNQFMLIFDVV